MFYKDMVLGCDPTDVQRVVLQVRRMGAFKPWGAAVSMIEVACLDIAGKALGCPIYKLLGGKVRDRVRVYNGNLRFPIESYTPEGFAADVRKMKESPEGFTIVKQGIAFHSGMPTALSDETREYYYGEHTGGRYGDRGILTEQGFNATVEIVKAMKEELGDEIGLALDCGPGLMPSDLLRLAKEFEPLHLMWMEDGPIPCSVRSFMLKSDSRWMSCEQPSLVTTPLSCRLINIERLRPTRPRRYTRASRSTCGRTSRSSSRPRQSTFWGRYTHSPSPLADSEP